MRLLESSLEKISSLLRVGFGEAGAGIVRSNLTMQGTCTCTYACTYTCTNTCTSTCPMYLHSVAQCVTIKVIISLFSDIFLLCVFTHSHVNRVNSFAFV
jgi:hypothetical protein